MFWKMSYFEWSKGLLVLASFDVCSVFKMFLSWVTCAFNCWTFSISSCEKEMFYWEFGVYSIQDWPIEYCTVQTSLDKDPSSSSSIAILRILLTWILEDIPYFSLITPMRLMLTKDFFKYEFKRYTENMNSLNHHQSTPR